MIKKISKNNESFITKEDLIIALLVYSNKERISKDPSLIHPKLKKFFSKRNGRIPNLNFQIIDGIIYCDDFEKIITLFEFARMIYVSNPMYKHYFINISEELANEIKQKLQPKEISYLKKAASEIWQDK